MTPDDAIVGNEPGRFKCIHDDKAYIVYLANPDRSKPGEANVSRGIANVVIRLPDETFTVRWFNPRSGRWTDGKSVSGGRQKLTAPAGGDWILLLRSGRSPDAKGPLRVHP
jgi:hypothetical protein